MINQLINKFASSTVLVIGDVMIDAYLKGSVGRISPEAPVPIVDVEERYYRLGGAANVAINLQSLGATPLLCSVIGNDEKSHEFLSLMKEHGLATDCLYHSDYRKTTIKYRIIANARQVLRVDDEDCFLVLSILTPFPDGWVWRRTLAIVHHLQDEMMQKAFLAMLQQVMNSRKVDAIIFEDYDKGVISAPLIAQVVAWAKERNIIVTVDPKKRNFAHYQGVDMFKPNLKELADGLEMKAQQLPMERVEQLMRDFAQKCGIRYLFTTMSEKGVALYDRERDSFFTQPAYLRRISDVSGAGDTVISVATLCLLAGLQPEQTAQIANLAGGIVCEYSGVTPIPLQRLKEEILSNHIFE